MPIVEAVLGCYHFNLCVLERQVSIGEVSERILVVELPAIIRSSECQGLCPCRRWIHEWVHFRIATESMILTVLGDTFLIEVVIAFI